MENWWFSHGTFKKNTRGFRSLHWDTFLKPLVVKGYDGGQMKASDWSKNYANHLVTSLNDRSDQKWSNQNGESSENRRLWNVIG